MKTKKLFLSSLILFLMIGVTASAQVRFGVKAEVGLNNPEFTTEDVVRVENMTTYSIGPSIEAMFPLGIGDVGVDATLFYNDNRMTIANIENGTSNQDVANRYLLLPVNAKIKFGLGAIPLKLYAAAGPYAAYLISGDEVDFQQMGNDIKAKSFQAGANLGFGVEFLRMIQLGLNYRVQLTDNYAIDQPDWRDPLNGKTQTWSINAAVYF